MSASRETVSHPQLQSLEHDVVKIKSACVSNVSPTSKISNLFFESPSQIAAHF